ncbi:hypothetical protein [Propionivibrio dicarboxylicus]|uniref:MSHA biogenesis protein MshK n=1 Tax=Propionivibrio dicarboxylicus TaxID=83767 RepID=A0A1G8IKD0_9RHOO|nr:hypothetical protein [Propionivibrio dicarboxylicus]SDI19302.1 hypothetical protein SAMN05660652_03017 [Propionivibrio dicarboxylicus]
MDDVLIRVAMVLSLSLAASSALAQRSVSDPMRPPVGIGVDPTVSVEGKEAAASPVLQSVVVPAKGKPIAIIGGQQVRLGEKIGENRLVRLNEREAVLEGPGGVERLSLTPLVDKSNDKSGNKNSNASVAKSVQRGGVQ